MSADSEKPNIIDLLRILFLEMMTSGPLGREGCSRPGFLACCSIDKRPLASLVIVGSLVFSSRMPHHCAVPLCSSNSKTSPGLSFHMFPSDPATRAIWVRNIRRDLDLKGHGKFCLFFARLHWFAKISRQETKKLRSPPYKDYTICFVSHKHFFSLFEIVMMIMIMMG